MQPGSEEHKELFCRFFIDTHKPFEPKDLPWPELSQETIDKLAGFPIWDYAVQTERSVYNKLMAYSEEETDPLLKEALALQGYEEGRHADIIKYFLNRYGIPFNELEPNPLDEDLEGVFLSTGAGECIDSFFAFGFIEVSKSTDDYPIELIEAMEPVVQEEARHILFIQNWMNYQYNRRPLLLQPFFGLRIYWSFVDAGYRRLMDLKKELDGTSFTMQATELEGSSLSPRSFVELCLKENKRRLNPYDRRLARPKLIPRVMSLVQHFL